MTTELSERPAATPNPQHRERLLAGLAAGIREHGFRETKVSDVVRHAKTSRRTFYEHFSSIEDCYLALVRAENDRIITQIAAALSPTSTWQDRVLQALRALVAAAEVDPAIIRSWIRELSVLGQTGRDLERETGEAFIALIMSIADGDDFRAAGFAPPSREVAVMLLGGLRELIASALEDGDDLARLTDAAVQATFALLQNGSLGTAD